MHTEAGTASVPAGGGSDLVVYVGHDGRMDFELPRTLRQKGVSTPKVIVLACTSKAYFGPHIRDAGSEPLLWTSGLMAPEAYTLEAALEGWIESESGEQIRQRAALAHSKYLRCSLQSVRKLFVTGW